MLKIIEANAAFANRKAPNAHIGDTVADEDGNVWPSILPSFRISAGAQIFTMGSCFARNIEDALGALGFDVPMLRFQIPIDEWEHRPSGVLNTYTPPNFRCALDWAARIWRAGGVVTEVDCREFLLEKAPGDYLDLGIASQKSASIERIVERRQEIYTVFKAAFTADIVVMTPGYNECWFDRDSGVYLAGVLKLPKAFRTGRFCFEVRSFGDCLGDMLAAIDLIRAVNPKSKIIVTTSPVPLSTTFTGQDIRIANMNSKATIRAVCGELPQLRGGVDYFPSYESVALSNPAHIWKPDRVHIKQPFIDQIVARLVEEYITTAAL